MTADEQVFTVAVLNCGYTSAVIEKERGQFSDIFAALLLPAFQRVGTAQTSTTGKSVHFRPVFRGYDTVKQVYPSTSELAESHAIIVTGSPNGAYEDLDWIHALNRFVSLVYHTHQSIKWYGSCFGHQIICQALFADRGAVVTKDPAGWELGVQSIDLTEEFARRFAHVLPSSPSGPARELRLQFLHGDHVILTAGDYDDDGGLSNVGVQMVGSTPHCAVQGVYQPGRLLTLQGHPEFDIFINTTYFSLVGDRVGWEADFTSAAITSAQHTDDAATAADVIVAFFLGQDQ